MAPLSTTTEEPYEIRKNRSKNNILEINNSSKESLNFSLFDLAVLILSIFSIISDLCTDLILVIHYSNQGYKAWAIGTFVLIFFPSIIVQFFSLRWHIIDKTASVLHWVLHFCMLGIIHRYFQIFKAAFVAYQSRNSSDIQKIYLDQSDLCMLHLFESFLESAPQLVLQMYIIAMLHEWRFWTGLSALASLLSLAWALASYTKAQRRARPNKNLSSWPGLLLQAMWRAGMLTSRILTLVLGAYCFGNYIFLIITFHWIGMTIWIVYQNTDFCETYWEERMYNAVVGVIYCFCFFNLQEGQSRWRALSFYLVIVFQNLTCLTIFLMLFAESTPRLAVLGFVAIVGGTVLGAASMLVYYRFFHPSGPIKLFFTAQESNCQEEAPPYSSMTLRSLKRMRTDSQNEASLKSTSQSDSKHLLNHQTSHCDSIVIVEENPLDSTDEDIKKLQNWINEDTSKNLTTVSIEKNTGNDSEKDGDAYKRRAICSSVDLVKLIESKSESECESNGSVKLVGTDEAPSEILSAHDYENLCAVNIAREAWGLRSWRGYSDIETWLHDDSVVHDRRLDTLTSTTTSSDRSGHTIQKDHERTRQDDYIDAIADDLTQCESEASSDDILGQYSIESLPVVYPLGGLDPILEELEELSTSTEFTDIKLVNGSASTLVATIDEIRRNTPTQNRYRPPESLYDDYSPSLDIIKTPQLNWKKVSFASKLLTFPEENIDLPVQTSSKKPMPKKENKDVSPKNTKLVKKESTSPKIKFDRKNTNMYSPKDQIIAAQSKCTNKLVHLEVNNKENIPTVASKINYWNKILNSQTTKIIPEKTKTISPKRINVKERRTIFLKKVLTPPKFPSFYKNKES